MATLWWSCIFLSSCFLYTNCQNSEVLDKEPQKPQIWSVINYLNNNLDKQYNYKYGKLIHAQIQDDNIMNIKFNAYVECRSDGENRQCPEKVLCQGALRFDPEHESYVTLPGATCQSNEVVIPLKDIKIEEESDVNKQEQPSQETDKIEESFVAIRSKNQMCPGCPVDLSTDVAGLDVLKNLALRHIESERTNPHTVLKVIRVQRQVYAGIKYILLLEIIPTTCSVNLEIDVTTTSSCLLSSNAISEICEVTYIERPWISKNKQIIGNNCTLSQEFSIHETTERLPASRNDYDNEFDINYNRKQASGYPSDIVNNKGVPNFDRIANQGNGEDLLKTDISAGRLTELKSQIVFQRANNELSSSERSLTTTLMSENVDSAPEISTKTQVFDDAAMKMVNEPYNTLWPLLDRPLPDEIGSSEKFTLDTPLAEDDVSKSKLKIFKRRFKRCCNEPVGKKTELFVFDPRVLYFANDYIKKNVNTNDFGNNDYYVLTEIKNSTRENYKQTKSAGWLYRLRLQLSQTNCTIAQYEAKVDYCQSGTLKEPFDVKAYYDPYAETTNYRVDSSFFFGPQVPPWLQITKLFA